MSGKKNKHRAPSSSALASRGIYNKGVRSTVLFMRIIAATYQSWMKRGSMANTDKLELEVVFNCSKKVLIQHFKVSEKRIKEIWNTFDPDYVTKEANKLYANMSRKIILSDDKRTGGGIIIPKGGMDLSKIAKEARNDLHNRSD